MPASKSLHLVLCHYRATRVVRMGGVTIALGQGRWYDAAVRAYRGFYERKDTCKLKI